MNEKTLLSGKNEEILVGKTNIRITAPGIKGSIEVVDHDSGFESIGSDDPFTNLIRSSSEVNLENEILLDTESIADEGFESVEGEELDKTRLRESSMLWTVETDEGKEYAILYQDSTGLKRWYYPERAREEGFESVSQSVQFRIPALDDAQSSEEEGFESFRPFNRLLRLISWVTDPVIGQVVGRGIAAIEKRKRPYKIVSLGKEGVKGEADPGQLREGRSLVLCHGTFSSIEGSFGDLIGTEEFGQLCDHYNGRVFGFDHPTLSEGPRDNANVLWEFISRVEGATFDVMGTSRGGLVARYLAEHVRNAATFSLGRLIFVATPNRGTPLAIGESSFELIDRLTNLIAWATPVTRGPIFEGILIGVKLLMKGTIEALPGLQAMNPMHEPLEFMNKFNAPTESVYGISSNFEARGNLARLAVRLVDQHVLDGIFREKNDGIVPSEGVCDTGVEAAGFPIPTEHTMHVTGNTHHLNYFEDVSIRNQVLDWLVRDMPAAPAI